MRRVIALLAALGVAAVLTVGASGSTSQISPQAIVCTYFFPWPYESCSSKQFFGTLNSWEWKRSPSTARRYSIGVQIPPTTQCLPSYASYAVRYVRQNGSVIGPFYSSWGFCGQQFNVNVSSNGEYVWADCTISTTAGQGVSRTIQGCYTSWN